MFYMINDFLLILFIYLYIIIMTFYVSLCCIIMGLLYSTTNSEYIVIVREYFKFDEYSFYIILKYGLLVLYIYLYSHGESIQKLLRPTIMLLMIY